MPSPYLLPNFQHLSKEYDAVVQCNRCGFCETVCPTYMITGSESASPRGRNQAFRQILEGKITHANEAEKIFSSCLTCHACTNVCYSEVPVGKLMGYARDIATASNNKQKWIQNIIFRFFLKYRFIFSGFVWISFFLKRSKISLLLKKIGFLKWVSPELDTAEDLISNAPLCFGAGPAKKNDASIYPKTAYFSGCGTHYIYPKTCSSFLNIAKKFSSEVKCPSHACCGLIPQSAGDIESAKILAKKNITFFNAMGIEKILVNDDSCCGYMKNYPSLMNEELTAVAFSNKVQNISEFLEQQVPKNLIYNPALAQNGKIRVTYHDSCQMGNGHHSITAPRKLLQSIQNVDWVELDEANWCCGGAGTYSLKNPELADEILERKLLNIKQSKAQILITQASSCLMHIQYGVRKKGWEKEVQVMHLAEFLQNTNLLIL